jgi:hypothetical protein
MLDSAIEFLPGTGRGTMRSMVEGARRLLRFLNCSPGILLGAPSTSLRLVPLPVPGRIK